MTDTERLREALAALRFYASEANHEEQMGMRPASPVELDGGKIARAALHTEEALRVLDKNERLLKALGKIEVEASLHTAHRRRFENIRKIVCAALHTDAESLPHSPPEADDTKGGRN